MSSPFLWGVATSAYQVEGAPDNDWTEWEQLGRLKVRGTRCGRGSGHLERWQSDFGLLPTLGVNAYRYSLERSRIEPAPGEFRAGFLMVWLLLGLSLLAIVRTERRQSVHDLAAGTVVIRARPAHGAG